MEKEEIIEKLFEKGVLVNKDMMQDIENGLGEDLLKKLENVDTNNDILVLNQDYSDIIAKEDSPINWRKMDKYRVDFENQGDIDKYQSHLQDVQSANISISGEVAPSIAQEEKISSLEAELDKENLSASIQEPELEVKESITSSVNTEEDLAVLEKLEEEKNFNVVYTFETVSKKYTVKDFSKIFLSRYRVLERIIRQRPEMKNVTSIHRLTQKKGREKISIIGLVTEIAETRNGNIIFTLEDTTGSIKVLANKTNEDISKKAKDLIFDEVVGISGTSGDGIIFSDDIVWPDLPLGRQLKKAPEDEFAIFLSDLHVGSNNFLEDEFKKFIQWVAGEVGTNEQKAMANKIKYIFIAGDVVDGVGIYPKQQEELTIDTIEGQYQAFTDLIKEIPTEKQIFICPGNHDVVHLAEPQPVFYREYTEDLHEMENVHLVSNPSMITIAKTEEFSGIDVLMYHGYSFDFYVANVDSIRNSGGYHRADLIMKYLLKRRHLAPAFKSTPYVPGYEEDPLLIKKVPDIMITGHIHYSSVANYKGVTMISGSCWQACTKFQEKLGHDPQPGRVPIVNLRTREVKVMKFV